MALVLIGCFVKPLTSPSAPTSLAIYSPAHVGLATQVWLVPFALFISLAANEQTLPGTAGGLPYGGAPSGTRHRVACQLPVSPSSGPARRHFLVLLFLCGSIADGGAHCAPVRRTSSKTAEIAAQSEELVSFRSVQTMLSAF